MDNIRFKYYSPVVSGTPKVENPQINKNDVSQKSVDFKNLLDEKIQNYQGVTFSKHASQRVVERNLDITGESLDRLNQGVKMANERNLNDALILVDKTAFLVNIPSNTVITAKDNNDSGDIFTNINGAVII